MTTEATSAVEIHDSKKSENQIVQLETLNEEGGQQADENGEATTDHIENKDPGETGQANITESTSPPTSPGEKSPGKQKREKEVHESKGISRFLTPWRKKQKSQSEVEPAEDNKDGIVDSTEVTKGNEGELNNTDEKSSKGQHVEAEVESSNEKHDINNSELQSSKEERKEVETQTLDEKAGKQVEKVIKENQNVEAKNESTPKPPKKVQTVPCKVTLLDKTEYTYDIEKRAKGQTLFLKVCEHLNLLETDYFGLLYRDSSDHKNWLDPAKEIKRQIRSSPWQFVFSVKFYPPDPSQLTEDITRYFLCLQLREDIASGRLPCSFVTHAVLGSLVLQAELGDYDADEHSADYISDFQFAPCQTKELEDKVMELHKTHRGLTPAQADIHYLENAKKLSMYGVDLHHAKDSEGVDIMLGVCANGLLIYKDRLRINRFAWPKILKISYKRSNFFIKVRPGETEQFESTIGFKLPNHRAAKRLWKVCVEHHTFYRLSSPEQPPKAKFLTLGSKFRYSGRTQAQTREASTRIDRPAPYFERTSSKRVSRSLDGAPIGSITDQSLLKEFPVCEAGSAVDGVVSGPEAAALGTVDGMQATSTPLVLSNDAKKLLPRTRGMRTGLSDALESSDEIQNIVNEKKQSDSDTRNTTVTEDTAINGDIENHKDITEQIAEVKDLDKSDTQSLSSYDSSSESDNEEAEYKAEVRSSEHVLHEEPEETVQELLETMPVTESQIIVSEDHTVTVTVTQVQEETAVISQEIRVTTHGSGEKIFQEVHEALEGKQNKMNGDVAHVDVDASAQIICCSEPPVVKTEMVTISDATQRTEIATKEVPIVQTETKTITFESAQVDGSGDGEPGILLSAQTITSDSVLTTTTTHITKTGKGGISETRIEKRIVISGDADIDHDEALAQAIKEAKEQHPDMSITRVVVHKETEVTEEGEED
ncbi:band 4.1-like protein 2 isoform X10 [Pseudophryne corroboree]|uniref:band 4.1-like protein 2 isoform X10 n=1 Tax=Pseudophryne corroboree TaxID=495146 RepID=UPI003081B958